MVRLAESFRFLLLLLTLVLLSAELTGLCHGAEVVVMAHDVESPPRPSGDHHYLSSSRYKQKQRSRWRRLQDFSESKRRVPSGPNPLHN
ncbi:unnamed protein product [Urochloa humidicola]